MKKKNSSAPKRDRAGQPPHKPTPQTRKTVEIMIAGGIQQIEIAKCIGITDKTLHKHYRVELDTSATKANAKIAQTLFQQAVDGNTAAAIWWTKARMNWKDSTRQEHTGADGGPIQHQAQTIFAPVGKDHDPSATD